MTVLDKDCAFWRLHEVFDYLRSSAAVNWDSLLPIVEEQRQIFASSAPGFHSRLRYYNRVVALVFYSR